jgi:pyridoxamine 5'-phosphate oxidase family protein
MEDVMREFTDAEAQYLGDQGLGWLATVGEDGYPRLVSVAFRYNPEAGAMDISAHRLTRHESFRDVQRTGVAALVVDDVLSPQRPRAIEVCGDAVTLKVGGRLPGGDVDGPLIRLTPRRVGSWGLEPEAPAAAKRSLLRRLLAAFADIRPWIVLLTGLLAWLVAFLLTTRVFDNWETSSYAVALTAWACAGGAYVLLTLWRFLPIKPEQLRYRLERQGTNEVLTAQVMGLWTVVIFVAAIIFTVVGVRSKQSHDYALVAAFAAVVASWYAIHLLYAEYYASQYYSREDGSDFYFPDDNDEKSAHGYMDFVYFALAIASTFGTTDVRIFGRDVRRSVMLHEILSFWFNVGIIATVVAFATG